MDYLNFRCLVQIFNPTFVPCITDVPACNVISSTSSERLYQNIVLPTFSLTSKEYPLLVFHHDI
jgi:hypothetical protein